METEPLALNLEGVSGEDWRDTRASVKQLLLALMAGVAELKGRISELEEENRHLREQLAGNSGNSSLPPSSDGPGAMAERVKKQPSGRKRGAQKGHRGHKRKLYPVACCAQVVEYHPKECRHCGRELCGSDPHPYRHQVEELPPVAAVVEEHRLHTLVCEACGAQTRASLPEGVFQAMVLGWRPRWRCWGAYTGRVSGLRSEP